VRLYVGRFRSGCRDVYTGTMQGQVGWQWAQKELGAVRMEMGELRAARQSALSVPRLGEGLARVKDDLQRQVDAASAALNTQAETLRAAAAEDRAALKKTLATDVQRAVRCVLRLQRAPLRRFAVGVALDTFSFARRKAEREYAQVCFFVSHTPSRTPTP